jgi:hypothetical protein
MIFGHYIHDVFEFAIFMDEELNDDIAMILPSVVVNPVSQDS